MEKFIEKVPGIYVLHVPFGVSWTGITLVRGEKNVLIDSGWNAENVDRTLIPALAELGLSLSDISLLLCTHTHGDHVGGHRRILELEPRITTVVFRGSLDKIRDPLKYNILIRKAFPEYSPAPSAGLTGIEPDVIVTDMDTVLADRLVLVTTPGHDSDTVSWYDTKTKTLICGDTLQANGTPTQGIGLYMYYPEYRKSLLRLEGMDIENILAGHEYCPVGDCAIGRKAVEKYLGDCEKTADFYNAYISKKLASGITDPVEITKDLIIYNGDKVPQYLFLALYTVTEHIKYLKDNK